MIIYNKQRKALKSNHTIEIEKNNIIHLVFVTNRFTTVCFNNIILYYSKTEKNYHVRHMCQYFNKFYEYWKLNVYFYTFKKNYKKEFWL